MKRFLLFVLLMGFCVQPAFSQVYPTTYRPPDLNWQQLKTPHFNILFPEGEDSVAYRTARILEHEYPEVQGLVGGELTNFPVVLNNFNDRSNGYVTTNHFRSEVEIPSIKGKTMNPQTGNWLETVVPHELVHALHYSHLEGFWAELIKLFSPDAARSIHGSVPAGVHEGIAVYHETANVAPDGGRGNYPVFTNQFDAVFNSSDRWSMGQMLSFPSYTRPFDRHYIGGYEFTSWLQDSYGAGTTDNALDFFIRWPFLGYGTALRHATGSWPGQLYDLFEEDTGQRLAGRPGSEYTPLSIPYKGAEIRRPVWLSDNKLLLYGSFYNASSGFYSYDLETQNVDQILETRSVQDYNYELSGDRSALLFSNYRSSTLYDNTYKMELYELDLTSHRETRLTKDLRAYAPIYHNGGYLALQTDHESSALIRLSSDVEVNEKISLPNTEFVSVKSKPTDADRLAIIANRRGLQGLWFTDASPASIRKELQDTPDISFMGGSVFDISWHPSGTRLMFSSDYTGTMQLYEYHFGEERLIRITDSKYNAMEGSYSPSGDRVAFVIQQNNERLPVVLERQKFTGQQVSDTLWNPSEEKREFMTRNELGSNLMDESGSWQTSEYRPGLSWLRPRSMIPLYSEVSNSDTYRAGLSFQGNDLLRRNAYTFDLSYLQDRLWYDLSYRHKGFFPGFRLGAFSRPSFTTVGVQLNDGSQEALTFLRQDAGVSLGIPTRFILESDVRYSAIGFTPSLKYRATRFFELDHNGIPGSDFTNFVTGNIYVFLNYRIQQNPRDLQPNSGLVLYSELEHYFNAGTADIEAYDYQIEVTFDKPTGWQTGLYLYTAPLKRWNQSLRLGIEGLTQTSAIFDNQGLVSNGFSEQVFPQSRTLLSFNTRYTIPLLFPDNGGFLLPGYLSSIYLVGFSDTLMDLDRAGLSDFPAGSRTVFGLGLRTKFRISNLTFDMGIGLGYEPSRNKFNTFIGNF